MSNQKPFEPTVGQGKESENTKEEMLKADSDFEKTKIYLNLIEFNLFIYFVKLI
jgi:hypothetical protein